MVAAQPSLVRLSYFLSSSEDQAREFTQEALVRTYAKWPQIREDGALAYTRRILANARIDRGRNAAREVPSWNPPDISRFDAANVENHDQLVALLHTLPEGQRKVVVLRYCCDLSERQVADTLKLSIGTVKSHASRGPGRLEGASHRKGRRQVMNQPDLETRLRMAYETYHDITAEVPADAVLAAGRRRRRNHRPRQAVAAAVAVLVLVTGVTVVAVPDTGSRLSPVASWLRGVTSHGWTPTANASSSPPLPLRPVRSPSRWNS